MQFLIQDFTNANNFFFVYETCDTQSLKNIKIDVFSKKYQTAKLTLRKKKMYNKNENYEMIKAKNSSIKANYYKTRERTCSFN